MNATKVQYTVKEDFVEKNKENIKAVMNELRSMGDTGVKYSAFFNEENRTFVHLVVFRDEEATKIIPGLESFKNFREQLKEGAETPPSSEDLKLVGASFDF